MFLEVFKEKILCVYMCLEIKMCVYVYRDNIKICMWIGDLGVKEN